MCHSRNWLGFSFKKKASVRLARVLFCTVWAVSAHAQTYLVNLPDLVIDTIRLEQSGEITCVVSNVGMVATTTDPDSTVELFLDGKLQATLPVPALVPGTPHSIATGVFIQGETRRLLAVIDPNDVYAEEQEYMNSASMTIDVFHRTGPDLSMDIVFNGSGEASLVVANVGTAQASADTVAVSVQVSGGTAFNVDVTTTALMPGAEETIVLDTDPGPAVTPVKVSEYDLVRVEYPFVSTSDLDSTNNHVERTHVLPASIDIEDPTTPYGQIVSNTTIRDAIKFTPACGSVSCPCPDAQCPSIQFAEWRTDAPFMLDGNAGMLGLKETLLRLEQGRSLPFDREDPESIECGPDACVSEDDGLTIYLNYLATTLWFEVHRTSAPFHLTDPSWGLSALSATDLEALVLDSERVLSRTDNSGGLARNVYPGNPLELMHALFALDVIQGSQTDAAGEVIAWVRTHSLHGGANTYGPQPTQRLQEKFFRDVTYPRTSKHVVGGCGSVSRLICSAMFPLGIPCDAGRTTIWDLTRSQPAGHDIVELPTIYKPGGATIPGVVTFHADNLHMMEVPLFGYEPADIWEVLYSTEEAECKLTQDEEDCPSECSTETATVDCPYEPICCDGCPEGVHGCLVQARYNALRHPAVAGLDRRSGNWVYDYFKCACLADASCPDHTMSVPFGCDCSMEETCIVESEMLQTYNGIVAEILNPAERQAYLASLDALPTDLGWTVAQVWDDIVRRSNNYGAVPGHFADCNGNGTDDIADITSGNSTDCNRNGIPDECDSAPADCNNNGLGDPCEIADGLANDCNANLIPDACEIASGTLEDCNQSGTADACDIQKLSYEMQGVSLEASTGCQGTSDQSPLGLTWLDSSFLAPSSVSVDLELAIRCDATGSTINVTFNGHADGSFQLPSSNCVCDFENTETVTFALDAAQYVPGGDNLIELTHAQPLGFHEDSRVYVEYLSDDCNGNEIPDECEIPSATLPPGSYYCESDCDPDCNGNGNPDVCDVAEGMSVDCNENGIPDECETDCNANGVLDDCDISTGTSQDCNSNSVPDECDIQSGTSLDCNADGVPNECEPDCNSNGTPDVCDILNQTSTDCQSNGYPDECDVVGSGYLQACGLTPFYCESHAKVITFDNLEPTGTPLRFDVSVFGVYSNPNNHVSVDIDSVYQTQLFKAPGGIGCTDYTEGFEVSAADAAAMMAGDGEIVLTLTPSTILSCDDPCDAGGAGSTTVEVTLYYGSEDCNTNSVPDECECGCSQLAATPCVTCEACGGSGPDCDICTEDTDCANEGTCSRGRCHVPSNRYLSFTPTCAESAMAIRIVHTASGATRWVETPGANGRATLGTSKVSLNLTTAPIHATGCIVVPGMIGLQCDAYVVQAIPFSADENVESNYGPPLVLKTISTWGEVDNNGVLNTLDYSEIISGWQGTSQLPWYRMDLDGNGVVNLGDVQLGAGAFSGTPYAGPEPGQCP